MKKYRCTICGYIYDEEVEKIKFEDLPEDWKCPLCGAPKNLFEEIIEENQKEIDNKNKINEKTNEEVFEEYKELTNEEVFEEYKELTNEEVFEEYKELTNEEMAYICSNLAKSCEKQYKEKEQKLYETLFKYYENKIVPKEIEINELCNLYKEEIGLYDEIKETAKKNNDSGTLRAITWSSKVSAIIRNIITEYQEKGIEYIKENKIWVCTICGFIYIGSNPPTYCPVCKVPNIKIVEVK